MNTKIEVYEIKNGNITGRNGHYDMPKLEIMHDRAGITSINGIGKSGKVLNAGLSLSTNDFKRVMADQFTDGELKQLLRDRNYALSIWEFDDVRNQAIENNILLTDDEIYGIIKSLDDKHDANIGINWGVIEVHIDDVVSERPDKEIVGVLCNVQYFDEPYREFETFIHFDHGEPGDDIPYTDDEVFFYCNGPNNVVELMDENNGGEFMVTKVHELMYANS